MGKGVFGKTPQADRDHETKGKTDRKTEGTRKTARRHAYRVTQSCVATQRKSRHKGTETLGLGKREFGKTPQADRDHETGGRMDRHRRMEGAHKTARWYAYRVTQNCVAI